MADGLALLERAISYTLGNLCLVTPEELPRPTPCRYWDLRELLRHLHDSLAALSEAAGAGEVGLHVPADEPADVVAAVRERAGWLLGEWTGGAAPETVSVAGSALPSELVAGTGAVEIAVHGWDVGRACGRIRPIPGELAEVLLPLSQALVTSEDRPVRFAGPVALSPLADPGDQLVAFLGRDPALGS